MRVAIISDIHGNVEALNSVLKEAERSKIDKYIFLGDFVGYLYYPRQVVEKIMDLDFHAIKGNHEDILYKIECGQVDLSSITAKYGSGHAIAIRELTSQQKDFLFSLPSELKVEVNEIKISLYHETPWRNNKYIYPDSVLPNILIDNSDYIFFGHSHYQFSRKVSGNYIYNPGSVGQNRENGGVANWIELDLSYEYIKFKSTMFPTEEIIKNIIKIDGVESYNYKVLNRKI